MRRWHLLDIVALYLVGLVPLAAWGQAAPTVPFVLSSQPFFPLGVQLGNVNEVTQAGEELRAAGFNCVLAAAPVGAEARPAYWQAAVRGLLVIQHSTGLGNPAAGGEARDWVRKYYDYSSWNATGPAFFAWLFQPLAAEGVSHEDVAAYVHAVKAGNPAGSVIVTLGPKEPAEAIQAAARLAEALAVQLMPEGATAQGAETAKEQVGKVTRNLEGHKLPLLALLPGDEAEPGALTAESLLAMMRGAREAGATGIVLRRAESDRIREAQLGAGREFAKDLSNYAPPPPAADREGVLATEAGTPLVWRLKQAGEVTKAGLTPYVTLDGSMGYNVTGRALLNLAIPNRSAWVDAQRLTRFSMRMFSSGEGQGALLALSTAGEVGFVRVPFGGGWQVYDLDLATATWESQKPEAAKWGGTTGVVQALSFTPSPELGSDVEWQWIRLEPDSTGEVNWELDKAEEAAKIEGLERAAVEDGELKGQATGERVAVEPALPGGKLEVNRLPFLSWAATLPGSSLAQVEYWWQQGDAEKHGGIATFRTDPDLATQCVDLSRIGFAGATVAGEERWGGPEGVITRLRLVLPAEEDMDWALDWVRLGPNYDLRAVPAEQGGGEPVLEPGEAAEGDAGAD